MRIEGQFEDVRHSLPMIDHYQTVTPEYFSTIGIPLIEGRPFGDDDRAGAPNVALVSESFARHFWPAGGAVGKRVGYPWPSDWVTIVGVVRDAQIDSLTGISGEAFYRPIKQRACRRCLARRAIHGRRSNARFGATKRSGANRSRHAGQRN